MRNQIIGMLMTKPRSRAGTLKGLLNSMDFIK